MATASRTTVAQGAVAAPRRRSVAARRIAPRTRTPIVVAPRAQGSGTSTVSPAPAFLPTSQQVGDVERGPHALASAEEVEARRAAIKARAANRLSEKTTYGIAAVASASGITALAVGATYFKFACVGGSGGGRAVPRKDFDFLPDDSIAKEASP